MIQWGKGWGITNLTLPITYGVTYSVVAIPYYDGTHSAQSCAWGYQASSLSNLYFETKEGSNWFNWGVCWITIGY